MIKNIPSHCVDVSLVLNIYTETSDTDIIFKDCHKILALEKDPLKFLRNK